MADYPEGEIRTLPEGAAKSFFGKKVFVVQANNSIEKRMITNVENNTVYWTNNYGDKLSTDVICEHYRFFPNYWFAYKYALAKKAGNDLP